MHMDLCIKLKINCAKKIENDMVHLKKELH